MDPAATAAILLMSVRRLFDKFIVLPHEGPFASAPLAICSGERTSQKPPELFIARKGNIALIYHECY